MTLNPVIHAAQDGDATAREALAVECRQIAWRLALRLTGDPDLAADLTQDAMIRFFGSLQRFQADRPLVPWIARIVRNLLRDHGRRRRVRRTEPLHRTHDDLVLEPVDPAPSPESRATRHELQRLVWRCLAELEPAQREIVVLRDFEGLAYAEIAAVLRIPRGTVMSRLHRARHRLAELVRQRAGEERDDDALS